MNDVTDIARELNARQIATPSGKPWSAVTVLRVQRRLEGVGRTREHAEAPLNRP